MVFCRVNQKNFGSDVDLATIDTLLKSVARTFYLSLTYLPKTIREPMSLAYLFARLSDTVVDAQTVPISLRNELLIALQNQIETPTNLKTLGEKIRLSLTYFANQDLRLLSSYDFLFSRLQWQSDSVQTLIRRVLLLIFEGQAIDLNYFDSHSDLIYFKTEQDLDRYLYLVAGSVGEFWTKLCLLCVPNFSSQTEEALLPKAISFGKALQLTNILRDLSFDLQHGRCYLPIQTPLFTDDRMMRHHPDACLKELVHQYPNLIQDWRSKAMLYLDDAKLYTHLITHRRIRFSVMVPMNLAHKSLMALPVKLSKSEVYRSLAYAWFQTYCFPLNRVSKFAVNR